MYLRLPWLLASSCRRPNYCSVCEMNHSTPTHAQYTSCCWCQVQTTEKHSHFFLVSSRAAKCSENHCSFREQPQLAVDLITMISYKHVLLTPCSIKLLKKFLILKDKTNQRVTCNSNFYRRLLLTLLTGRWRYGT